MSVLDQIADSVLDPSTDFVTKELCNMCIRTYFKNTAVVESSEDETKCESCGGWWTDTKPYKMLANEWDAGMLAFTNDSWWDLYDVPERHRKPLHEEE